MSNIAIRVESLGKMYRIGGKQERYRTLRDTLTDAFAAPFRRASSLLRGQAYGAADLKETIWALKDVSFEVKHGEVVGIIGRNGAGKSTLLKILSRITEPTEGYADVYGRVGSLLEVGTGFHPELTGRENIYLNGAILGMSRAEIDRKFDEIVAFAEIEKFIDTPVKHYSSGMGLRLGFAVAAHLEPEILVVDEVLAVGDAQFQKKCLGKMSEVAGEGRTVLFVSHNMAAVNHLCSSGILLNNGLVSAIGAVEGVVSQYLNSHAGGRGASRLEDQADRTGNGLIRLTEIALLDALGTEVQEIRAGAPAVFAIRYKAISSEAQNRVTFTLRVEEALGQYLFSLSTRFTGDDFDAIPTEGTVVCRVPSMPLVAGRYRVYVSVYVADTRADAIEGAMEFDVTEADVFGTGRFPTKSKHGAFFVEHSWELQHSEVPIL